MDLICCLIAFNITVAVCLIQIQRVAYILMVLIIVMSSGDCINWTTARLYYLTTVQPSTSTALAGRLNCTFAPHLVSKL